MGALSAVAHVPLVHAQSSSAPKAGTPNRLRIVQSAALSGPQAEIGLAFNIGAKAAFAAANAAGGIHGRLIEFISADDGYDANKAVQNTTQLLSGSEAPLALFGYTGTACTKAVMPLAKVAGVMLFAPVSSNDILQSENQPQVFFVRGTHSDEITKILTHLTTIGSQRIGVFYPNDDFGQGKLALVNAFASQHKLPTPKAVPCDPQSPDFASAAKALVQGGPPQAVVHLTSSQYSGRLLKELNGSGAAGAGRLHHYGISSISAADLVREANRAAHGFVIAKRVPNPSGSTAIAADFRHALQALQPSSKNEFSSSGSAMEGYVAARLLMKAMQNAGPKIDRAALRNAAEGLGRQEIGPFTLTYGPGKHRGSPFVDLAMVREDLTVLR
jgi:branched-chain amino acid transport system substrate-binding protein